MSRRLLWLAVLAGAASCSAREDIASVAAEQPPFDALRGISVTALRVAELRAFRRELAPLPAVGLHEIIDGQHITYLVPVFDSSSLWPREDAMVMAIWTTRQFASDSLAHVAWDSTARALRAALPDAAPCAAADPAGQWTAIEFPRGGGLVLSAEYEPSYLLMDSTHTAPTIRLAIRRASRCATP